MDYSFNATNTIPAIALLVQEVKLTIWGTSTVKVPVCLLPGHCREYQSGSSVGDVYFDIEFLYYMLQ